MVERSTIFTEKAAKKMRFFAEIILYEKNLSRIDW